MDRRERIIEVCKIISDLRNQLRILETELDSLLGPQIQTTHAFVPAEPEADGPIAERIIRTLEQGHEFDSREMLEQLGLPQDKLPTIRSTLYRLAEEQRIARPTPGRFAALRRDQAGMGQPDQPHVHGVRNNAA